MNTKISKSNNLRNILNIFIQKHYTLLNSIQNVVIKNIK